MTKARAAVPVSWMPPPGAAADSVASTHAVRNSVAAVLAGALLAVAAPAVAHAQVLDGGFCSFENFSAGRNLGTDGASTAAGAAAIIANGSGVANQVWTDVG
jgi:hypothetical protein